ncbi:PH domain-containing protein [Listeria marthii]|nr:PH domain-containing protein [Listeria marthii]UHP13928.1 PH domain-containing protein [Listeria marthii]
MELENLEKKLPEKIKTVWRQTEGIAVLVFLLCSVAAAIILYYAEVSVWWSAIGFGLTAVYAVFIYLFIIPFRFARWSYQIKPDEMEIQHGIIFRSRVLIPMIRIQHVETEQGPLLRRQKLVSLSITTAARTHKIEAVNESDSDELRHHILELVKVAKEDV